MKNPFTAIRNYLLPTQGGITTDIGPNAGNPKKNLRNYISPVQLARIITDVAFLNEAIGEVENSWYPQRIKLQQLFLTTIRNGHVSACMDRRMNLTKLKDYRLCTDGGVEDEDATKLLKAPWFRDFMRYGLEAKAFGYSLITLGDLIDNAFPKLSTIRRFNVSPDRLNVTQYIYSISGANFMDEPYADWHVWVPTPTDVGVSLCGYGYLYKVALYEIFCRNTLSQNSTAAELFGMPLRVAKTSKTEEDERGTLEQAMANMGAAGYVILDLMEELEFVESKGMGQGYKIFESLEMRCEKKISKIILGHSDAMDSTPGKLGSSQAEEDKSPAGAALRDTATNDMVDLTDLINGTLLPKLINLGFPFDGLHFEFSNNDEMAEQRDKEDAANLITAEIAMNVKLAGGDMDWDWFNKRTGMKASATPPPPPPPAPMINPGLPGAKPGDTPVPEKIKNKLEKLYGK